MKRHFFCLTFLVTVSLNANGEATFDASITPGATESGPRIEFHQRVEGEEEPPLLAPAYELMTQPCMGWRFQAGVTLYNADADRELMLLTSSAELGGALLVIIALENNANISLQIPGTAGAWAMAPMKGDRVAIGTYFDGSIHIYNLPENKLTDVVAIPGEAYIWNLVEGGDGRLYGGTYPGGKLVALDQATLKLEVCGQVAAPNRFLHEVSPLPDGRLLCRVGDEAPGLYLYDPADKTFTAAPENLAGITGGTIWDTYFVTRGQVFNAELEPISPPPFTLPKANGEDWSVLTAVTNKQFLFLQQGNAVYRYQAGDKGLTRVYDFDLRGGTLLTSTEKGSLAGIRGQQYFHIKTGDEVLSRQQLNIASPPRIPTFLQTDATGQVWGGPDRGQTLFFMDGRTGVFVSMGSVTPSPGGVVDVAFAGTVAYGVCSPGGEIFRLDIDRPWHEWDGKNPEILHRVSEHGYSRATGGIIASTAMQLYSGWSAAAGTYGGAIAVTEPESGKTRLAEHPLGRQAISGLAADDHYLFAGTTLAGEDLPVMPDESPQFAVLGLDTVQPYQNHVFSGAVTVDRLLYNAKVDRVAMAVDGRLHVFNITEMKMQPPFEPAPPEITSTAMATRNDACAYYGHSDKIVRVHLETGAREEVLQMPGTVGALTANAEGDLYAACGIDIYRVRFPENYADNFISQSDAEN